jgi:hypothetical protein
MEVGKWKIKFGDAVRTIEGMGQEGVMRSLPGREFAQQRNATNFTCRNFFSVTLFRAVAVSSQTQEFFWGLNRKI